MCFIIKKKSKAYNSMISLVFSLATKLHTKAKCLKSMALKHFMERQCVCLIWIWKLQKKKKG